MAGTQNTPYKSARRQGDFPPDAIPTAQRILDIAERLVQTRGFNAFSYADIASALGMTKASLHYHFASKGELGARLITRYDMAFMAALAEIERAHPGAGERLRRYIGLYEGVLRADRMCLCGMLAAEYATLTPAMQTAIKDFFGRNEQWLVRVLQTGRDKGELSFRGTPLDLARMLVGSLEGAMMLARSCGDATHFRAVATRLLDNLTIEP